jgi:hypothetical protein
VKECLLPELNTEEFMVFKNMGAYTISGAVAFNGIPLARSVYVASTSWDTIKNAFDDQCDDSLLTTFMNATSTSTTSCAVAANLAFTRSMSIQLVDDHDCCDSDSTTSSDERREQVNNLISDVGEQQNDDLDQTNVDCAITC